MGRETSMQAEATIATAMSTTLAKVPNHIYIK